MIRHILPLLLALAAALPAQAAHRVKGHWRDDGTWVRSHWVGQRSYNPYRGGVGDPFYRLNLTSIFSRPFRRQEAPPAPAGFSETWRSGLNAEPREAPKDYAFADSPEWRRTMDRIRWGRGEAPASLAAPAPAITGVVWTDTGSHRVKTKYRDGEVVGEWRFAKKNWQKR